MVSELEADGAIVSASGSAVGAGATTGVISVATSAEEACERARDAGDGN